MSAISEQKKKWSGYILLLIILGSAAALPLYLVEAQNNPTTTQYPSYEACVEDCKFGNANGQCTKLIGGDVWGCFPPGILDTTIEGAKQVPKAAATAVINPVLNAVAAILVGFSALLLGVSGIVVNLALNLTVVNMAGFINSTGSITIAWELIRDVINAVFIFIVLFLAITIILRIERFGGKKMLANIIIAALLINFSLFFTRIIIDASNIITYEFYKPIEAASGASVTVSGNSQGEVQVADISLFGFSAAFMKPLGLTELYSAQFWTDITEFSLVIRQLFSAIFLLVAAFVFFAVGILLAVRFVIFVILLITSPMMFLGLILPKGSEWSRRWWNPLWEQVLWPPIFMILASMSFIIISNPAFKGFIEGHAGNLNDVFAGADLVLIAFNFIIVIGFLVASLIIAKTLASKSAKGAVDFATKVAGKATFGLAGWAGRRTFGAAGARLRESEFAGRLAASKYGKYLGRGLILSGDKLQKASFDARGKFGTDKLGAGQGQKGGYEKMLKDQQKRETEYDKLSATARAKKDVRDSAKERAGEKRRELAEFATRPDFFEHLRAYDKAQQKIFDEENKYQNAYKAEEAAKKRGNRLGKRLEFINKIDPDGTNQKYAAERASLNKEIAGTNAEIRKQMTERGRSTAAIANAQERVRKSHYGEYQAGQNELQRLETRAKTGEREAESELTRAAQTVSATEANSVRQVIDELIVAEKKDDNGESLKGVEKKLDRLQTVEQREYALAYREYRAVRAERESFEKMEKQLAAQRDLGASGITLSSEARRRNARGGDKTTETELKKLMKKYVKEESEKEGGEEKPKEEPKKDDTT